MKRIKWMLLAQLVAHVYLLPAAKAQQNVQVALIPEPKTSKFTDESFKFSAATPIFYRGTDAKIAGELLNEFILAKYGFKLSLRAAGIQKDLQGIFISNNSSATMESYKLSIGSKSIVLTGDPSGIFYGIQTVQQLAPAKSSNLAFPGITISDEPRFGYRGLMLDVCRHFYSLDYIKKFLDVMSHFKLNTFHWHLTDDQGWRIEIKKYPKLQSIAAWREPVDNVRNSDFVKDGRYGGYYTQEEIKQVVAYAAKRHITVIPEIEMPGHSLAALSAYPELGCTGGPYKPLQYGGISADVYCAGKEQTFEFLQNVLREVIPLFPGQYIHVGGDETPKDRWKSCPHCQARIKKEGLRDEHQLQSYFVQRMEKFVNSNERKIIGWDEILEGGIAPNATVMSWRGEEGGIAAARQHHDVIMTPYTYLYLDYYQGDAKTEPPAFPALLPLEKVYSYEPYSSLLTTAEHAYIKGVQGNLWSENIRDGKHADYMVFPRGLALAEIAWSPAAAKNYTRFLEKLKTRLAVMDQDQINFRIPEPVGLANQIGLESSASVRLATGVANSTIFYTLDGSQPSAKSDKYTQPFTLQLKDNQPILLKTIVVLASGRQSGVYTATLEKKPLKDASSVRPTALGISYRTTTEKVLLAKELRIAASEASKSMSKIGVAALPQAPFIGALYEGYIFADSDGMYSFKVRSDDGAVLYIDEELVVDNDGPHPPREVTGSVALQRGYHKIKLHYFDSGEGRVLEVSARKGKDNYELDQKLFIMGE